MSYKPFKIGDIVVPGWYINTTCELYRVQDFRYVMTENTGMVDRRYQKIQLNSEWCSAVRYKLATPVEIGRHRALYGDSRFDK